MRCLSLWQPWASLVAIGAKKWETRSQRTRYRGALAIQASKKWSQLQADAVTSAPFIDALAEGGIRATPWYVDVLPFGAIVAVVDVVDCISSEEWTSRHGPYSVFSSDSVEVRPREYEFGNYDAGRFAWKLENLRPLKEPLPYSARQGLFTLEPDVIAEVNRRIA